MQKTSITALVLISAINCSANATLQLGSYIPIATDSTEFTQCIAGRKLLPPHYEQNTENPKEILIHKKSDGYQCLHEKNNLRYPFALTKKDTTLDRLSLQMRLEAEFPQSSFPNVDPQKYIFITSNSAAFEKYVSVVNQSSEPNHHYIILDILANGKGHVVAVHEDSLAYKLYYNHLEWFKTGPHHSSPATE